MIDLRELVQYEYLDDPIRIACTDGQVIIGLPDSVDEEDESGLEEPGITVVLEDGGVVVVGLSEIESITILQSKESMAKTRENRRVPA